MKTTPRTPGPDAREKRAGFSLIEVVLAMMILTVGVLGLAGTTGYMVGQVTLSDLMTERSAAFQTVVDRLQAAPYGSLPSGSDSVGVFAVDWTSVNSGSQNMLVTIVTTGPGLKSDAPLGVAPQVADTFQFRLLRR